MRHLKRKHEDAYKSVLDEKREIRAALAQQQANKDAVNPTKKVLASKYPLYPTTRKQSFITEVHKQSTEIPSFYSSRIA